jgi:hypothetical protein
LKHPIQFDIDRKRCIGKLENRFQKIIGMKWARHQGLPRSKARPLALYTRCAGLAAGIKTVSFSANPGV